MIQDKGKWRDEGRRVYAGCSHAAREAGHVADTNETETKGRPLQLSLLRRRLQSNVCRKPNFIRDGVWWGWNKGKTSSYA